MAVSVVQRTSGTDHGTNGYITLAFSANVTAGNVIIVAIMNGNSTNSNISTPTDTLGSTYSMIYDNPSSNYVGGRVYIAYAPSSGANTVTVDNSLEYSSGFAYEVTGLATSSPLDQTSSAVTFGLTDTIPAVTTSHPNELLLAFFGNGSGGGTGGITFTAGSGYGNTMTVGSSFIWAFSEEQIVSSVGSYGASATTSDNNAYFRGYLLTFSDLPNNRTKTQTATGRITEQVLTTQTATGRIRNVGITKTQPSKANIGVSKTKTQTAIGKLVRSVTITQPSIARIRNAATTKTQSITSRIRNTATTKTQSVAARLTISIPKTQPATARIFNTNVVKTQTTKARLQWVLSIVQTSTARVQKTLTKTQTSTARIRRSVTKTQTAIASVQHVNSKTQTSVAKIVDIYKMQILTDGFTGTVVDSTKWNTTTSSFTTSSQNNEIIFTLANGHTGTNNATYKSVQTYDLRNSYALVELAGSPNPATHAQAWMKLYDSGSANYIQMIVENGTLKYQKFVSSTLTTISSIAYVSNSMKWWRLRDALGILYAEYSGDGVTWTTLNSQADVISINAMYAELGAGTYQSETSPGLAIVENFNLPPTSPVKKDYQYKVYRGSTYLGLLPNVSSDFSYSQEINTAGSQITVQCGISADTSSQSFTQHLTTEAGDRITTEAGVELITEGASQLVGPGGSDTLIMNGNKLKVYEFSQYYPNGHLVFSGQMQRWEASFGGDNASDAINILAYSDGYDTDHYILLGSPYTVDVSQTSQNATDYVSTDARAGWNYDGQTWTTGTGITNVGSIDLMLNGTANVTVHVWPDVSHANSNTGVLGSTTVSVNTGGVSQVVNFAFSTAITLTAATQYFFSVTVDTGQSILIYYQNTNIYAGGVMQNNNYGGGSGGGTWGPTPVGVLPASDLYFKTYTYTGSQTTAVFSSLDPTTGMMEQFMDNYHSRGGNITYNSTTVDATGLSLSYTFNTNTIYEGIEAVRNLAPDGFYYYVDIGTSLLHMKQTNTTPDIVLTKGRHINTITVVATIENIANLVYFSGGTLGTGFNLFKTYQDNVSLSNYGQRIDRLSDNRVTLTATADALGNSDIAERSDEQYQTVVTVLDGTMDISAIKVGMVVGFNGFGTFADNLTAQVVRIDYTPETATLTLGILPKRLNPMFERIRRGLIAEQTINNPS